MANGCTEKRLRRAACVLIGCTITSPCCDRCGADLYDDYIQYGWLDPLFRLYWSCRRIVRKVYKKKCDQCGKRYWRGYDDQLCSEECHDNWLPF